MTIFAFTAGPAWARDEAPRTRPRMTKFERWLGRDTLAVLRSADRMQPFAIWPWHRHYTDKPAPAPASPLPPGTPADLHGFAVLATAPAAGSDLVHELTGILLDESSYLADHPPFSLHMIKGCLLFPGVAIRVWSGARFVDVLLCFQCDEVAISRVSSNATEGGLSSGDIDPARAKLVHLVKRLLPDVPAIANIPSRRPEVHSRWLV